MAYATRAQLAARLKITTSSENDLLDDCLEWATAEVNRLTGRTHEASASTTKYFGREALDPFDRRRLYLWGEDLRTVSAVANGDASATAILSSAYRLEPWTGPPYYSLRLLDASSVGWEFDTDGRVAITGTWGYAAAADGLIEGATLVFAEYHYRRRNSTSTTTIYSESQTTERPPAYPADTAESVRSLARLGR